MDTSETGTETATNIATTTGLTNRPRNQHKNCRFIRLASLICVVVGCSLTVVGQVASQKSCEIAGPVVIAMGGLLLIFQTFWDSRNKLTDALVPVKKRLSTRLRHFPTNASTLMKQLIWAPFIILKSSLRPKNLLSKWCLPHTK